MKRIVKGPEPTCLSEWKTQFYDAFHRVPEYKDFRGTPEWAELIQILLMEQGYLCCYCMQEVNGWDSHIEHFIPRNIKKSSPHSMRAENVELGYDNLFISCNGEHGDREHCGRFKDREDSPMILSPSLPDIEEKFRYHIDGQMDGLDESSMSTIRILNLDSYTLRRHRRTAIYHSGIFDADFDEVRDELIHIYSERDEHGAFTPFCIAILSVIKHFSA